MVFTLIVYGLLSLVHCGDGLLKKHFNNRFQRRRQCTGGLGRMISIPDCVQEFRVQVRARGQCTPTETFYGFSEFLQADMPRCYVKLPHDCFRLYSVHFVVY